MDIRQQQAYYQQMRQQQVYRAYAAGLGSDTPTPPPPTPTLYSIKFVTEYSDPNVVNDISVFTETQKYTDIKINGEGKEILSGNVISYCINLSNDTPYPIIRTINGQDVGMTHTYQSTDFQLTGDTTISIGISDF